MTRTNGPGRPIDRELRDRILAMHRDRPDLRTHQAIAAAVGCCRRTVARVLPPLGQGKGRRMVIPAELVAKAEERGGVLAVLEAALAVAPPSPEPPLGVRDRWLPGQRG